MPSPLIPATPAFAADGTPFSQAYGDLYHSAEGGPGQARHVFLRGNGLPERWRGRRSFAILETGFGFGLSFLTAWQAWRDDPQRCERLHFVSVEKHPFARPDLSLVLKRYQELKSDELVARWPMLVPGMHRIEFDSGSVVLTLLFGDIAEALPQLRLAANAIFLDGFAPAKNPGMWEPRVLRHLGRLAAPGATLATWSVAAPVRAALEGAGFRVEKRPGFGSKKEMLAGSLIPRPSRHPNSGAHADSGKARSAIVIGAGIAGAAVCARLAARGWGVTLLERQGAPPAGPGRHAGVFHPVVTRDDSLFARLTRAAFLYASNHWNGLDDLAWERCGVLQLARDEREQAAQRAAIDSLALPPGYAQYATREAASARAGVPVAAEGVWYPHGGWIRPLSLIAAQLASAAGRLEARFSCEVARIAREGDGWSAYDHAGALLARAPVMVLANAAEALKLAPARSVRIRRVRGQISFLPAAQFAAPRAVVLRGGFVLPAHGGESIAGASYDFDDEDPAPRADSHAGNLERLERILPGNGARFDPSALDGMVGFRAVAPDRLPLIGALADEAAAAPGNPLPATLPRLDGLYGAFAYGSRGLLWAGLGAELLASMLEGEPLPMESRLADAVDPGRFLLRSLRRGTDAAPATSVPA
ncbi:MAG TPA: bifunctional tRNA (5-methylaminomethyl-2-thiouridine)(34)-methyltransferase MnmD/FAD-dependent 5-carboxymethylaminomethyl-2-thiouridine(34) oxidoreductase MnmC [Burkholderiales bacterium]|nr:bifunctional tRNA (5-methylaminomethyl-2-thiouridine)(34)-methyltransferase MnmD/FAD-dependent 5-carboxymethylaminomethyl-2-thiouridine(34) oxidoreductase MnmC [Burkholderiales bacterium]